MHFGSISAVQKASRDLSFVNNGILRPKNAVLDISISDPPSIFGNRFMAKPPVYPPKFSPGPYIKYFDFLLHHLATISLSCNVEIVRDS